MESFALHRTSTPTPGHVCDGGSFGNASSVHSGLGGEELSYVPASEDSDDEPPAVFNCSESEITEVCICNIYVN